MNRTSPPISPVIPLILGMITIPFSPIFVRYTDAPAAIQGLYRMLFTVLFTVLLIAPIRYEAHTFGS